MSNLIMGAVDGSVSVDLVLEKVDHDLEEFVRPRGVPDAGRLMNHAHLVMPDTGDFEQRPPHSGRERVTRRPLCGTQQ